MAENNNNNNNTKKKAELIFITTSIISHLASALELAKLLINRDNRLSITFLCIKSPFIPSPDSHMITSLFASTPQIKLILVPGVETSPHDQELPLKFPEHYFFSYVESFVPHVKATMQNILSSCSNSEPPNPVAGIVLDLFCVSMVDVGKELGIPSYSFIASNAGFLSFVFSLEERRIDDVFNISDPDSLIPGISKLVPSRVLPAASFNRDGGYATLCRLAQRFRDTKGIIVNTFSELECYAIDALSSYGKTPPIYPVGPLINLKGQHNRNFEQAQHDKVLKWLDQQPPSSVVFLCFGSMGSFGPSQTREIALALRRSGVRFLWIMRSTPTEADDDEKALLEGFLEWMEGKGMLCKWAPQVEVLAHKAIGGFVSHCGWNSILESLWFGVPTLTWPIYAEQQLNAFRMARESGLAVELTVDYRASSDLVIADEIENGLKHLMDGDIIRRGRRCKRWPGKL